MDIIRRKVRKQKPFGLGVPFDAMTGKYLSLDHEVFARVVITSATDGDGIAIGRRLNPDGNPYAPGIQLRCYTDPNFVTELVVGDIVQSIKADDGNYYLVSAGGGIVFQRARCQQGCQSTGKISVKLLDASGAVVGSAFDCWMFADKCSNVNTTLLWTMYGIDLCSAVVFVFKDSVSGEWFLASGQVGIRKACR